VPTNRAVRDDAAKEGTLTGRRVLVVEDEFLLARFYQALLEDEGCIVIGPAYRESEALQLLQDSSPDAAVLDVNLRGKRAARLARALSHRAIPFVVATAYGDSTLRDPVLLAAPRLVKPIDAGTLILALHQALGTA